MHEISVFNAILRDQHIPRRYTVYTNSYQYIDTGDGAIVNIDAELFEIESNALQVKRQRTRVHLQISSREIGIHKTLVRKLENWEPALS